MSGLKEIYPTLRHDPNFKTRRADGNPSDTCSKRLVSLEQRDGTPDYILENYSGEWFMKWRCSGHMIALGPVSIAEARRIVYQHAAGCGIPSRPPFMSMS